MVLPFPSLIMAFIARVRVKLLSGLSMMPMDYPISAQTMTRSKAHITGPSIGISQIPRDDIEEEIDQFTSSLEGSAQPSSQACTRAPDRLDRLIAQIE